MENENEKSVEGLQPTEEQKLQARIDSNVEQIRKFCADLPNGTKLLIIGADVGKASVLIHTIDRMPQIERIKAIHDLGGLELMADEVNESLIRTIYSPEKKLCVIVEDADKLPINEERVYTLTNPYKKPFELMADEPYIGRDPDPKKKHWDKPKFMGGDAPAHSYRSGGNNRKRIKRKKAKNGKKKR